MKFKLAKVCTWTAGMAFAGAILGAKGSHAHGWFKPFIDKPAFILVGAFVGFVLGLLFSQSQTQRDD